MTSVRWKQPLDCVSIPDDTAADLSNVITSAWISRMAHKPEASSGEEERDFRYEFLYWYMVWLEFRWGAEVWFLYAFSGEGESEREAKARSYRPLQQFYELS